MPADWKHFGNLLTNLLWQIKDAGGPAIEDLQEMIGQALGKQGGASIAKWRQGQPVARQQDVEGLVQALAGLAQDAGLPRESLRPDLRTLLTLADHPHPDAVLPALAQPAPVQQPLRPAKPAGRTDWGRSPDVAGFVGREQELAQLRYALQTDRSRLCGVFGLGGVGKTFLPRKPLWTPRRCSTPRDGCSCKTAPLWMKCSPNASISFRTIAIRTCQRPRPAVLTGC